MYLEEGGGLLESGPSLGIGLFSCSLVINNNKPYVTFLKSENAIYM